MRTNFVKCFISNSYVIAGMFQIGHLFAGPFDNCLSSLGYEGGKGLRALILNVVGLKVSSINEYINRSFIAHKYKLMKLKQMSLLL